jgi:hypothetical protein
LCIFWYFAPVMLTVVTNKQCVSQSDYPGILGVHLHCSERVILGCLGIG